VINNVQFRWKLYVPIKAKFAVKVNEMYPICQNIFESLLRVIKQHDK